jgi:hypothetical protein
MDTARTLVTILDNQQHRTAAAFEELPETLFSMEPGGDCNTIRDIGLHLLALRKFQLAILGSAEATDIDDKSIPDSIGQLLGRLVDASGVVREAILAHDDDDWYCVPETPRKGMWGDEPTINRFSRPFNDYVNHLGSIRTIRRIAGHGVQRTQ